jgi:hypothetical protein
VPRIHFRPDAPAVKVIFEAKGEGFFGAVLYDPSGRAVAAAQRFIDLGDEKAYPYKLAAAIPPAGRGKVWSLDIQAGRLVSLDGAPPFFATSRAAFFSPDKAKAALEGGTARKTGRTVIAGVTSAVTGSR